METIPLAYIRSASIYTSSPPPLVSYWNDADSENGHKARSLIDTSLSLVIAELLNDSSLEKIYERQTQILNYYSERVSVLEYLALARVGLVVYQEDCEISLDCYAAVSISRSLARLLYSVVVMSDRLCVCGCSGLHRSLHQCSEKIRQKSIGVDKSGEAREFERFLSSIDPSFLALRQCLDVTRCEESAAKRGQCVIEVVLRYMM
ncbi:hypothetical protein Tco_0566917 [Tanacetum coccineum]